MRANQPYIAKAIALRNGFGFFVPRFLFKTARTRRSLWPNCPYIHPHTLLD
jgi:hypothetical protein